MYFAFRGISQLTFFSSVHMPFFPTAEHWINLRYYVYSCILMVVHVIDGQIEQLLPIHSYLRGCCFSERFRVLYDSSCSLHAFALSKVMRDNYIFIPCRRAMFFKFPTILLSILGNHKIQPPQETLCSTTEKCVVYSSRRQNQVIVRFRVHSNIDMKERLISPAAL